jgi:steroid 5-alpha reductase family enzyme
MNEIREDERYQEAKKRVTEIKSFYSHLFIFFVVNVALFFINLATSPGTWWFYWPLFGWGIGIAAHAFSVFCAGGKLGRDWEQRKIKEIMEKEKREEGGA